MWPGQVVCAQETANRFVVSIPCKFRLGSFKFFINLQLFYSLQYFKREILISFLFKTKFFNFYFRHVLKKNQLIIKMKNIFQIFFLFFLMEYIKAKKTFIIFSIYYFTLIYFIS